MKNLVKSLSYLLLLILTLLILNGCIVEESEQIPQQIEGKLLIWHALEGNLSKIITNWFEEFEKLNPQVTIVSEAIPETQLSRRFIRQSKNGFGASGIIIFSKNLLELIKSGHLQEINPENIDLSTYFPLTIYQVRYQGKIYAIPLGSQTRILCYNQAKLQASQDPILSQPPTHLEGLIERAHKGYSVGMVSSFEDTFWGIGLFNNSFWDNQGNFQPKFEAWAKWMEWLKYASIQPNFVLNRQRSLLHDAFAKGNLTYYVCNANEIVDLQESLKDNLRVALLPQEGENKAKPLLYTQVIAFNRSNSPKEYNLGLALAKFFTNQEQQLQGIVQTQSFIPTNRRVRIDANLLPIESVLWKQSQNAVVIPLDNLSQLALVFEKGDSLYERTLAGEITTTEAARRLTQLIEAN